LAKELIALIENPARLTQMESASRALAKSDAAVAVVDLIEDLLRSQI
jgi:UDP-N-acetylglucosamine:LPS N-acetylglucosamine transferase